MIFQIGDRVQVVELFEIYDTPICVGMVGSVTKTDSDVWVDVLFDSGLLECCRLDEIAPVA